MRRSPRSREVGLARVLLVDDNPTSRLTLKTVLEAGGYDVDSAASAAEASGKLEDSEYELVLSDLQMEDRVIRQARAMSYRPATAVFRSYQDGSAEMHSTVLITPEAIPELLSDVAELIAERASRRIERQRRMLPVVQRVSVATA